MPNEDYNADVIRSENLNAQYMKQQMCINHGKRCADCGSWEEDENGNKHFVYRDEYGDVCKYGKKKEVTEYGRDFTA